MNTQNTNVTRKFANTENEIAIRKEKLDLFIELGYKATPEFGVVTSPTGNEVGNGTKNGYKYISQKVGNKVIQIYVHQLIYYVATGKVPSEINHIDINKLNCKIDNLEESNRIENSRNKIKTNKLGTTKTSSNKYKAQMYVNGKLKYIGTFLTEDEAYEAYLDFKKENNLV